MLELAQPGRGEVGLELAGHADEHHAAARARDRDRLLERRAGAHAVEHRSKPPSSSSRPPMADQAPGAGDARALEVQAIGRADVVGAEAARRAVSWPAVLGHARIVALGMRGRAAAASVSSPIVPAPITRRSRPAGRRRPARRVQRAGERLDQHRVLVGQVVGHGVQLRARGRRGPRSSRRRSRGRSRSAGPRRPTPSVTCAAERGAGPARTRGSGVDARAPRSRAPAGRTTRSPGAAPAPISPTISWPGTNGVRGERRQVQRRLAVEQRLVGAADAAQARRAAAPSPGPGGAAGGARSSVQRARPARHRPRGQVARQRWPIVERVA